MAEPRALTASPPNRWLRHSLAAAARMVLATLAGLLVWTVLPVALGWQPNVVMSGSMAPAIRTGDVVLTREVPADQLQPGHVLLVEDPGDRGTLVLHRYDRADDAGGLVLRGDANEQADSTPVAAADVRGVGVLRVPWVGLPYVWAAEGRYLPVGLTAFTLLALVTVSPIREQRLPGHTHDADPAAAMHDAPEPSAVKARHAVVAATLLLIAGGSGVASSPVSATFSASSSVSVHMTAGTWETAAPEALRHEADDTVTDEFLPERGTAPSIATLS